VDILAALTFPGGELGTLSEATLLDLFHAASDFLRFGRGEGVLNASEQAFDVAGTMEYADYLDAAGAGQVKTR